MRCENCGGEIGKPGKFCPFCGERLETRRRRGRRGAALLLILVLCAVLAAAALSRRTPEETFLHLQGELLLRALSPFGPDQPGADVKLTAETDNAIINRLLRGSGVTLKARSGEDGLLVNANIGVLGSTVLTGAATLSEGTAGFYMPEVRDVYYTVNLDDGGEGSLTPGGLERILALPEKLVRPGNVTVERGAEIELPGGEARCDIYVLRPAAMDMEEFIRELGVILGEPGLRTAAPALGGYLEGAGFTWSLAVSGGDVKMVKFYLSMPEGGEMSLTVYPEENGCQVALNVPRDYLAGLCGEVTVTLERGECTAEYPEAGETVDLSALPEEERRELISELSDTLERELIDNVADSLGLLGLLFAHGA